LSQPNHKKQNAVKRPDNSVEMTSYESVLPDPETLKKYEEVVPGAAREWMDIAKSEIKARQTNESRITWTFQVSTIVGQVLAFFSVAIVCCCGLCFLKAGHPGEGAAIIVGSAASVITAFLVRSYLRNKDSKGD
jgi:uncharacterized membrane protein